MPWSKVWFEYYIPSEKVSHGQLRHYNLQSLGSVVGFPRVKNIDVNFFFFFIRTKFIRTCTLRLSKKAKNNFRLQRLFVLKFDLCS